MERFTEYVNRCKEAKQAQMNAVESKETKKLNRGDFYDRLRREHYSD